MGVMMNDYEFFFLFFQIGVFFKFKYYIWFKHYIILSLYLSFSNKFISEHIEKVV